ncbi:hypothetical protein B0O99DRAFT_91980 [Bisporella sp. PMI_857]|nr:hypothetical protein B0O99DRAFT_91980 [Bisporella sp. PMI_857]
MLLVTRAQSVLTRRPLCLFNKHLQCLAQLYLGAALASLKTRRHASREIKAKGTCKLPDRYLLHWAQPGQTNLAVESCLVVAACSMAQMLLRQAFSFMLSLNQPTRILHKPRAAARGPQYPIALVLVLQRGCLLCQPGYSNIYVLYEVKWESNQRVMALPRILTSSWKNHQTHHNYDEISDRSVYPVPSNPHPKTLG